MFAYFPHADALPKQAPLAPFPRHLAKREEIIVPVDFAEFREELQIRSGSVPAFPKSRKVLAGSVEDAVEAVRVVKAVSDVPSFCARDQSGGSHASGLCAIR